jgi:hypothetical protein
VDFTPRRESRREVLVWGWPPPHAVRAAVASRWMRFGNGRVLRPCLGSRAGGRRGRRPAPTLAPPLCALAAPRAPPLRALAGLFPPAQRGQEPRGGGVGCGGRARAAPARSRQGLGGGSGGDGGGWSPVAESHIRVLALTQSRPPRRCDPAVRQIWRR